MLKLILADNQAIFRAGIAKVLAVEDEMRIVAQAQTQEQMFMALDKFRAAVLVVAGGFHSDFTSILQAANKAKTRVVVLADTGESAQRYMAAGAHGVVYRNVTSAALVDCVRNVYDKIGVSDRLELALFTIHHRILNEAAAATAAAAIPQTGAGATS